MILDFGRIKFISQFNFKLLRATGEASERKLKENVFEQIKKIAFEITFEEFKKCSEYSHSLKLIILILRLTRCHYVVCNVLDKN